MTPASSGPHESRRPRAIFQVLLQLFSQRPDGPDGTLLSFDQVQQLLRSRTEFNRGTQAVPIASIVGSVGRYRDFTRAFLPLNPAVEERRKQIGRALQEMHTLPAVEVYQIGEVYFVRDGNHRVSLARSLGLQTIQAHVTEIESRVPLTPEVDVDDLIVKSEYAQFLEKTHLDELRSEQRIELTAPGRYGVLLEHIEVHGYYMGLEQRRQVSLQEAAASWYDTVYMPVLEAIRGTQILQEFPARTEADLYLWIAYHRERLKETYGCALHDREVASLLASNFSDRPLAGLVRSVVRAMRAAVKAATESPEPPPPPTS